MSKKSNGLMVFIVILCCNSKRWIETCLESVMKTNYESFHVILVDNGTTDGSTDGIEKIYSKLTVLRNEKNVGWCKGNNIGIEYAMNHGADYVFLSNSDIDFFDPNWLNELILFKNKYSKYKIIGPVQYEYNEKNELNEWTKYILENGNRNVHYMWSDRLTSKNKKFNYSLEEDTGIVDVYFIQGAAMLIDAKVFNQIGLFDKLYFIFYDEVDFCRRNLRVGNKIALVPSSKLKHYGSGDTLSSKKKQKRRNFYFSRNKYYFIISDYNMRKEIKREILIRWVWHDIKDSLWKRENISSFWQLIHIYINLVCSLNLLKIKRKEERYMESNIIKERIIQCIQQVLPNFTMDDFEANLNTDFGLDSIAIMELNIYLEEEFNIEFDENVSLNNLYDVNFIFNYIMNRDI